MEPNNTAKLSFSKQVGLGWSTYGTALNIIFSKGLWIAFAFPLILILAMFLAGFEGVNFLTDWLKETVFNATNLNNADFFGAGVLKGVTTGVIWVLLKLLFFVLFSYFGGFIVLIILSPVLAFLSERTEKISAGHQYPFNINQLMRDIVRGILIAMRNMIIQFALILGIMLFSIIPLLGWIVALVSPIVIFFITSYFYGFSFMDYNNERCKLSISQSVRMMRKYKWVAVANGSILAFVIIIPSCGLGTLMSPFVAIVSVVAGSLAMEKIFAIETNGETTVK